MIFNNQRKDSMAKYFLFQVILCHTNEKRSEKLPFLWLPLVQHLYHLNAELAQTILIPVYLIWKYMNVILNLKSIITITIEVKKYFSSSLLQLLQGHEYSLKSPVSFSKTEKKLPNSLFLSPECSKNNFHVYQDK